MNLNKSDLIKLFGNVILVFPLLLMAGPLIAEIFLFLIVIFSFYLNNYKEKLKSIIIPVLFLGLFYISTIVSTSINYYNFDYSKSGIFFFRVILFSFSIYLILTSSNFKTKKILLIFNFFLIIIIIDSLTQFYLGQNLLGYKIIKGRVSSFFNEELILGSFLIKVIPIFFIYLIFNNKLNDKKINFFYLIILSLISLVVFLSGERTSFFLLLIFYFILFLTVKNLRKLILYLCIIYFFLILITSFIIKSNHVNPSSRIFIKTYNQILNTQNKEVKSEKNISSKIFIFSQDHQSHYELSIKIIKDNFFLGTGVKGFRYLCRNKIYILEKKYDGCSTHPHNTYFQIFTSNGLVGFILIVMAYIYIIKEIIDVKRKLILKDKLYSSRVAKIIILVALFINFWPIAPSGNFFNNWLSIFYFYQIGIYLYFKNENKTKIS